MSRRRRSAGASEDDSALPFHWRQVQSAIWLVGLAILFWQGWLWPGILFLVAISGLFQAFVYWRLQRSKEAAAKVEEQQQVEHARAARLPEICPSCGAALTVASVVWVSATTARCPYCNNVVKTIDPAVLDRT